MSISNDHEPQDRIRDVLRIWEHNRQLYPGWLVFPSGQERSDVSRRTDEWEPPILNALDDFTPVEQLRVVRELVGARRSCLSL